MHRCRVLWIEDSAHDENAILANPVFMTGDFDMTVALTAAHGVSELLRGGYDAIVVDIRLPPGEDDPRWVQIYYELHGSRKESRLGLKLLDLVLGEGDPRWTEEFPASSREPGRYGVLSVETYDELKPELERLGVVVYSDKARGDNRRILLETIRRIVGQVPGRPEEGP